LTIAFFHNLPSGGALRALYGKIRVLKEKNHKVALYAFSTSDMDFFPLRKIADENFIEPLRFRGIKRYRNYFRATRLVAQRINHSDAGIVIVEKCRFFGTPPILRYLKKPTIFYTQEPLRIQAYEKLAETNGDVRTHSIKNGLNTALSLLISKAMRIGDHFFIKREDKRNIQSARCVITNSHYTAGWLKRVYGIDASVHYQGVDNDFFYPEPSLERKHEVLTVGRLDVTKGYDFLLRVIALIPKEKRPKWMIICDAVDKDYARQFRHRVQSSGIEHEIKCRISEEELRHHYRESQLVLCASVHEPFGLVPLEAMACGTPVIAVREGGFVETVVDGETGFLLDRNEKLWAERIEKCICSPELIQRFGISSRQHVVNNWTWVSFADKLEGIFTKANV